MSNTKEILDSRDALHDRIEELEGELAACRDVLKKCLRISTHGPLSKIGLTNALSKIRAMIPASQEGEES